MSRRRLPEKLYRIGEVIEHTGLSRQTLHFYATIGLISEKSRTRSGYRLFPPSVFAALDRIRRLKKSGHTLRQIREIIEKSQQPRLATGDNIRTTEKSRDTSTGRKAGPR